MDTSVSLLESLKSESDDLAWQTLYHLYSPLLRNWLGRFGAAPADVEDLVQEVLVVVMRRVPEFERETRCGAFRSWLRTIAYNCLRDHWKKRKKQGVAPGGTDFGEAIEQLADPRSGLSKQWDREYERHVLTYLLEQIRDQFSERTWKAFERYALDGQPVDEVAQQLEMSPNAVFIAKSRVMNNLREFGRGLVE